MTCLEDQLDELQKKNKEYCNEINRLFELCNQYTEKLSKIREHEKIFPNVHQWFYRQLVDKWHQDLKELLETEK